MTCLMMTSLGVYVLGAAEDEERRRVEAHLPHCASCRAELLRLAPIPGLLAGVPPEATARLRGRTPPGGWLRRGRLAGSVAGLAASVAAAAILITGGWGV